MSLPETQQAAGVIAKASNLLLLIPPKPSADAFASMAALYISLLESHPGNTDAVSPSHVPLHLQFLPGSSQVVMQPALQPQVVVDIAGPEEVIRTSTNSLKGGVRINLTLPAGTKDLTKESIEVQVRQLPYDAIITFGTTDLQDLGELFLSNADFFYNTPIINIDHRGSNEHYGTVNLVDLTASSIAEVTHELIEALPNSKIEGNIATCLYAGIVAATESFQKPSTTPTAFQLAAELMNKKADKELVIQNLVKTKPLPLLKLSGRAYARLQHDPHGNIFWTTLKDVDFQESSADKTYVSDVMHELTNNISGFNVAFIIYPDDEQQSYLAHIMLGPGLYKRRQEMVGEFGATKQNGAYLLPLNTTSPSQAETTALERLRPLIPNT